MKRWDPHARLFVIKSNSHLKPNGSFTPYIEKLLSLLEGLLNWSSWPIKQCHLCKCVNQLCSQYKKFKKKKIIRWCHICISGSVLLVGRTKEDHISSPPVDLVISSISYFALKVRLVGRMKKWKNRKYFSFSRLCLVGGWKSREMEDFFVWLRLKMKGLKIEFV